MAADTRRRRKGKMPPELVALFQRYNQLGRLLPSVDADDDWKEDPRAMAEVACVIKEMDQVKAQIDEFLAAARRVS